MKRQDLQSVACENIYGFIDRNTEYGKEERKTATSEGREEKTDGLIYRVDKENVIEGFRDTRVLNRVVVHI